MIWSIDVDAEDWTLPTPERLVETTIARLDKAGKGILLMHDVQPVLARALPMLLAELKRRNFQIVHVTASHRRKPSSLSLAP
jgi:peptidoglycan/xylan/chitin deacetylase (PgdA/CDA1 family)